MCSHDDQLTLGSIPWHNGIVHVLPWQSVDLGFKSVAQWRSACVPMMISWQQNLLNCSFSTAFLNHSCEEVDNSSVEGRDWLNLNLLNFFNGKNHHPFFWNCHYHFINDIKMRTWNWSVNSIEPGQTAQMCSILLVPAG